MKYFKTQYRASGVHFLFFCLALLCTGSGINARSTTPRTVTDFYLLLPEEHFDGVAPDTRAQRLNWLYRPENIVDTKNGYIYLWGDGAQQTLRLCLFKSGNGSYLLVVQDDWGEGDALTMQFYRWARGKLHEIKSGIIPLLDNLNLTYKLPRYGHTIRVTGPHGHHLYDLVWNGMKFIKK